MQITIGKILALLIALGYLTTIVILVGGVTIVVVKVLIGLLIPLALIWFPEELGSMAGSISMGHYIDMKTPSLLVSIAGWFFLVVLPLLMYLLR